MGLLIESSVDLGPRGLPSASGEVAADDGSTPFLRGTRPWPNDTVTNGYIDDGLRMIQERKGSNLPTVSCEVWALSAEVRSLCDGRRDIQKRNDANTPTVLYTRGLDLSGSLEGAGEIGGLLGRRQASRSGLRRCDGSWA